MQHHNEKLQKLRSTWSDEQKRLNELNREQGASSWLTTIPFSEEGYDLTKSYSGIWSVSNMVGHSQDYYPIVNVAISLMSSMPFLAKRRALFLCDTTTSEILRRYC